MSKRTYIGDPSSFADRWQVVQNPDGMFRVYVEEDEMCLCGCPNCVTVIRTSLRLHTTFAKGGTLAAGFADADDAREWIEGLQEDIEQDYDDYLEENRYEIAQ